MAVEQSLTIPAARQPNTYFVIASIDATLAVPESNETDNEFPSAVRVVTSGTSALSFVQQPSDVVARHKISPPVRVRVVDTAGAVVPGALVQLTLVVSAGSGG